MALATRTKPKSHHKKRQAQHHRQSKHYLKTYWPYLPMVMIVALGIAVNNLWSHASVLGAQQNFSANALLAQTNAQRSQHNESILALNTQLTSAAQAKANDMVAKNYWAHTSPSGQTPWSFITAAGYQYQIAGENLAYGFSSADATITGWMNSADHRANVLDVNYQDVGFGIAQSSNFQGHGPQTIVVAEYAEPASILATIEVGQATTPASSDNNQEISAQPVSRVQTLTGGQAAWSLIAVSALAGSALTIFVIRHGYRVHRLLNRGEAFMVHHPWVDISLVLLFMLGFILSRSSGVIR